MTYIFLIQFNLNTSGRLYIPGLERVVFEIDNELTEIQLNTIKTKITNWFDNKLGLPVNVNLDQRIK